jgi:Flp pilus assembly protein TadG
MNASRHPTLRTRHDRSGERGQVIVLFILAMVTMIAMAGLLVDGGLAWANRRQAQAAADTAALAAAQAIVSGSNDATAARTVAGANGFGAGTDCHGHALPDNGVTVNRPPADGAHAHDANYVEVITTRRMQTSFAAVVGQGCWMVSARAVSSIGSQSVAQCSFCSLNRTSQNHTLVLKTGATLRVDGDIYVNSTNGGTSASDCDDAKELKSWFVCGDGFDIFGTGGSITARTISVAGGWETHDANPVKATSLATTSSGAPCLLHPDPPSQTAPWLPSDVCIHMPQITDPLNDPANPGGIVPVPPVVGAPVSSANGCPAGATIPTGTVSVPSTLTINSGNPSICPGTYYGGISIGGSANVTMMPGVYYMAGGGFRVSSSASVNGTAGVMIYNASGTVGSSSTNPGVDLVPAKDKSKKDVKNQVLASNAGKNPTVGQVITLTMTVSKNGGATPTGLMSFFDGNSTITGCDNVPSVDIGSGNAQATCATSWSTFGTKAVSAVYYGDAVYNAIGDTLTINLPAPAGNTIAPINITTTGTVALSGPTSGTYKGMTMFQDRTSDLTITLSPGLPANPCTGGWMNGSDAPKPCGALGGIQGTIYAANDNALVYITASGSANLQVISGKIQVDSDVDARFSFTPQFFANGSIHLVE